jgi:hypothetical protein
MKAIGVSVIGSWIMPLSHLSYLFIVVWVFICAVSSRNKDDIASSTQACPGKSLAGFFFFLAVLRLHAC